MSEEYERMMELREPLMTIADAAQGIALALQRGLPDPPAVVARPGLDESRTDRLEITLALFMQRLLEIENVLLELYPDNCRRHGIVR